VDALVLGLGGMGVLVATFVVLALLFAVLGRLAGDASSKTAGRRRTRMGSYPVGGFSSPDIGGGGGDPGGGGDSGGGAFGGGDFGGGGGDCGGGGTAC
jgi:hypothetical protein